MTSWQLTLVVISGLVLLFQYLRARRGIPDPYDSDQSEPITRLGLDRLARSPKRPPAPSPDRIMDRVSDPPSTASPRPPPPPPPFQEQEEGEEKRERDGVGTSERLRWIRGAVVAAGVVSFLLLTDWRGVASDVRDRLRSVAEAIVLLTDWWESPERKAEAALQEIDQLAVEIAVAIGELGDIEDLVETNPLAAIATLLNPDRRCPLLRDRLRTTEAIVRKIDRIEELFPVAISAAQDQDEFRTGLANANEMRGRAVAVISWLELAIRYGC